MFIDENICPLCGKHHFEEPSCYEFCSICGWCDDGSHKYPDDDGGYNRISFNQAKKLYKEGKLDWENPDIYNNRLPKEINRGE